MGPCTSICDGTVIARVVEDRPAAFVGALTAEGIEAVVVGEVMAPSAGLILVTSEGEQPLGHPGRDPFWRSALPGGWSPGSPPPHW